MQGNLSIVLHYIQWDWKKVFDYCKRWSGHRVTDCILQYMVTVPHEMVREERMSDYRGFGLYCVRYPIR